MVRKYVMFDEDIWSSRLHVSPSLIEGSDEVILPKSNLEVREESNWGMGMDDLRKDMYLHSNHPI